MAERGRTIISQVNLRALFFRSCVIAGLLIPIGIASTSVSPYLMESKLPTVLRSPKDSSQSATVKRVRSVTASDPTNYNRVLSWKTFSTDFVRSQYELIEQAAQIYGVPSHLLRAMLLVHQNDWPEGNFENAFGPMRLSSQVASELQVTNLESPRQGIFAGAAHLSSLMIKYSRHWGVALGAYRTSSEEFTEGKNLYSNYVARHYAETVLHAYALLIDEEPEAVIRRHMPERPRDSLRWIVSAE